MVIVCCLSSGFPQNAGGIDMEANPLTLAISNGGSMRTCLFFAEWASTCFDLDLGF